MAGAPGAAVPRLRDAMAARSALILGPEPAADRLRREIASGVCFAYTARPDRPVRDGFDLTVPASSPPLAIVGRNGAGKTTLAKLSCRLHGPQAGAGYVGAFDSVAAGLRASPRGTSLLLLAACSPLAGYFGEAGFLRGICLDGAPPGVSFAYPGTAGLVLENLDFGQHAPYRRQRTPLALLLALVLETARAWITQAVACACAVRRARVEDVVGRAGYSPAR